MKVETASIKKVKRKKMNKVPTARTTCFDARVGIKEGAYVLAPVLLGRRGGRRHVCHASKIVAPLDASSCLLSAQVSTSPL